jgi:hypothetical protein
MNVEYANRETVSTILRDAVLYAALVAVGGSWATFIREAVIILIPHGIVGEVTAVFFTTILGIVVAVSAALSLRVTAPTVHTSTLTTVTSLPLNTTDPHLTLVKTESVTARAMRLKGMHPPRRKLQMIAQPNDEGRNARQRSEASGRHAAPMCTGRSERASYTSAAM